MPWASGKRTFYATEKKNPFKKKQGKNRQKLGWFLGKSEQMTGGVTADTLEREEI